MKIKILTTELTTLKEIVEAIRGEIKNDKNEDYYDSEEREANEDIVYNAIENVLKYNLMEDEEAYVSNLKATTTEGWEFYLETIIPRLKRKPRFTIFCNETAGETKPYWSLKECIDGMTKRHQDFWSNIQYKDQHDKTINVSREFIEQGMSLDEVVADYLENASPEDLKQTIYSI